MTKFNLFGFGPDWLRQRSSRWKPTKTCTIHPGRILIPKRNESGEYEPGMLQCPECGNRYTEDNEQKEDNKKTSHIVRKRQR